MVDRISLTYIAKSNIVKPNATRLSITYRRYIEIIDIGLWLSDRLTAWTDSKHTLAYPRGFRRARIGVTSRSRRICRDTVRLTLPPWIQQIALRKDFILRGALISTPRGSGTTGKQTHINLCTTDLCTDPHCITDCLSKYNICKFSASGCDIGSARKRNSRSQQQET